MCQALYQGSIIKKDITSYNKKDNPVIFEGAVITVTVAIMCPAMSFIAAIIYFPFFEGFSVAALLCHWFKLVCFNLPFAFFSQHLFIQPLVRRIFKLLFRKDIANRKQVWD